MRQAGAAHPLGNNLPATDNACSQRLFPPTVRSREQAKTMPGWTYCEIETGHNAMMLMPAELADMLAAIG